MPLPNGLMPNYLNPNPHQSNFDELNEQLESLPTELHVRPDDETFQPDIPNQPSKRQKTDPSGLPSLRIDPDSPLLTQKNHSTPLKKSQEETFSNAKTSKSRDLVVNEVPKTASTCCEVKKRNSPPLDTKHQCLDTRKVIAVCRFEDLISIRLKHKKLRSFVVENVEAMTNADKPKKRNVSLIESFTEEEIKLHIKSLKEGSSQCEKRELDGEICQLCGYGALMFPPPAIYCSSCSHRIKDNSSYYIPDQEEVSDSQKQICNSCYNRSRSKFLLSGIGITKATMVKKNNIDNQIKEEWVQCEACKKWQHQICGLYNIHKDPDKSAAYICPYSLLKEPKRIGFDKNAQHAVAKDLDESILSHFIEQRLFRRLKEERYRTAKATQKSINDVSEAKDLTLRVVYSADKVSTVNKQFVDFFHKEDYPSEFPYKSKKILLFQKVDGVDVCIFALFVQEFGSECSLPNQRSVYIVYLDSVKYFRPERATFTGEALRTFVYHEILIGYLEYCKIRGFATSYIWACPPQKGEDYIINSHPKTQQTPNTKKLRQWYLKMLQKAKEQRVVVNVTNLYNRFFGSTKESNCKITAAQLPYFEGSFWSNNAELLIQEIEKKGDDNELVKSNSASRRKLKGIISYKRGGCVDVDDAKKILLMLKLEKSILQNKEDLIVVELNYSCTLCSKVILSGWRWFCQKCKNLQLCGRCYDTEEKKHIHTIDGKEKHCLSKVKVNDISSTTEDGDIILENDIFESRQVFLSFSQKNNYNFDTLRRAKHSSMMLIHHLHTSNKHQHSQNSSSVIGVTCTACKKDVSNTIYFPCLVCEHYQVCSVCYTKNPMLRQIHLFSIISSTKATPPRTDKGIEILEALMHTSVCSKSCSYPKCKEVKALFKHGVVCKVKENCLICNCMWKVIRIHSYHCQDPKCIIPRCGDMKENLIRTGLMQ